MTFSYFTSQVKSLNAYEWNFHQCHLKDQRFQHGTPFQYCIFSIVTFQLPDEHRTAKNEPQCISWPKGCTHIHVSFLLTFVVRRYNDHSERPKSAGSKSYTLSSQVTSLVTNIAEWVSGLKRAPSSPLRMRIAILCRQSYTPMINAPKTIIEQIDLFSFHASINCFSISDHVIFAMEPFFFTFLPIMEHMTLMWKRNREILLWISHVQYWENKT